MKPLSLEDLTGVADVEEEQTRKQPIELDIAVAGATKTIKKTVEFHTNDYGLIVIKFKEGGILPLELQGQFTGTRDAIGAVNEWQARTKRELATQPVVVEPEPAATTLAPEPSQEPEKGKEEAPVVAGKKPRLSLNKNKDK